MTAVAMSDDLEVAFWCRADAWMLHDRDGFNVWAVHAEAAADEAYATYLDTTARAA